MIDVRKKQHFKELLEHKGISLVVAWFHIDQLSHN